MTEHAYDIESEEERHQGGVRALLEKAFGPQRLQRAIYRLREGVPPDPALCFVMVNTHGQVVGVVRNYRVRVGAHAGRALLLGPIAVAHSHEKLGLAARLIRHVITFARQRGYQIIYLVGDPNYYGEFGFKATAAAQVNIENLEPGKIILGLELTDNVPQLRGRIGADDSVLLEQLHKK